MEVVFGYAPRLGLVQIYNYKQGRRKVEGVACGGPAKRLVFKSTLKLDDTQGGKVNVRVPSIKVLLCNNIVPV